MIAIPLDEPLGTTISHLYGNAKYMALLDLETGIHKVVKNEGCGDGEETAKFVANQGITSTLFYHMGEGIFNYFDAKSIKVYSVSKIFTSLEEVYRNFSKRSYKQVTKSNASSLLDTGHCACKKK